MNYDISPYFQFSLPALLSYNVAGARRLHKVNVHPISVHTHIFQRPRQVDTPRSARMAAQWRVCIPRNPVVANPVKWIASVSLVSIVRIGIRRIARPKVQIVATRQQIGPCRGGSAVGIQSVSAHQVDALVPLLVVVG